jgi:hypothetical protein
MKNILLDIRYLDMQIKTREKRICQLVEQAGYNKLFGNTKTALKQARLAVMHDEALEGLRNKLHNLCEEVRCLMKV